MTGRFLRGQVRYDAGEALHRALVHRRIVSLDEAHEIVLAAIPPSTDELPRMVTSRILGSLGWRRDYALHDRRIHYHRPSGSGDRPDAVPLPVPPATPIAGVISHSPETPYV